MKNWGEHVLSVVLHWVSVLAVYVGVTALLSHQLPSFGQGFLIIGLGALLGSIAVHYLGKINGLRAHALVAVLVNTLAYMLAYVGMFYAFLRHWPDLSLSWGTGTLVVIFFFAALFGRIVSDQKRHVQKTSKR